jgi:hypothetical protein
MFKIRIKMQLLRKRIVPRAEEEKRKLLLILGPIGKE